MQLCRTKFRKFFILSTKKWTKSFPWKNPVNSRGKLEISRYVERYSKNPACCLLKVPLPLHPLPIPTLRLHPPPLHPLPLPPGLHLKKQNYRHTHKGTHAQALTNWRTLAHTYLTRTHAHTHAHTHRHKHARTHARTRTRALARLRPSAFARLRPSALRLVCTHHDTRMAHRHTVAHRHTMTLRL